MAEYYQISREEKEDLLYGELGFPKEIDNKQVNPLRVQGTELVYGKAFKLGNHPLSLRVYSTIQSGAARKCGGDSIKVCLLLKRPDGEIRGISKAKRVFRVKGWRANLKSRIEEMIASIQDIVACPKCGLPMAKRKGSNGEFYGCTDYPNCKGTRAID